MLFSFSSVPPIPKDSLTSTIELNLDRQLSPPAMILIRPHAFVIILLVILCLATSVSFEASVGLKIFR